ncbi:MAG: peptidylprolyl isomerase [Chromatiales bacterium]|nr:peptidylprolyl isomerase [Chromatiales bacterium]
MSLLNRIFRGLIVVGLLFSATLYAKSAPEVLVTIGTANITSDQLDNAVASSPFATQFVAMDERDQASLRGDMLRRLVAAQLLKLEAESQGFDKTASFKREMDTYRMGLLYRHYMDKLREKMVIPDDVLASMKHQFMRDPDGVASAKSAYKVDRYRMVRLATIQKLQKKYGVKLYQDRITIGLMADTVLMDGNGLKITYGDIVDISKRPNLPNPEWIKAQLYKRAEILLIAKAADEEKIDVSSQLNDYKNERLPALMLEMKEHDWIKDERVLKRYYIDHPEMSRIPEKRHIGQLVVKTKAEATALRNRILRGESLFSLAAAYSIDDFGRKNSGDIGWVEEGRGMPALDQAASKLADRQLSPVIETKEGYNLITILERKAGKKKNYMAMRDRVRQVLINEKMRPYLGELERKFGVSWNVIQKPANLKNNK